MLVAACLQGMEAVERYFTVAKRIALFLARTSSQHTIDHLVYEISRQISEDDDTAPAVSSDTGVSHVLLMRLATRLSTPHASHVCYCQKLHSTAQLRHRAVI